MSEAEEILTFWFPPGLDADEARHRRQFEFWFRGGANAAIARRFASERLGDLDRCTALADALIAEAPIQVRALYQFSASQARGHHDVVARFGRQPHRNAALGRESTAEELDYLAAGRFVHRRSFAG